ncbi:hypothetical protein BN6_54670 [Saccharothrix espanaensis DSM 44229]|uniref:Uncharacterized protein n=1 Tax=Saccharothrix espanaensis (strain ATCC 51144 / DSM 44229 / JCM 9112 / NBRC 15066 / NRRL 15764) TaxID=1179773 RepID=K0K343_SACES|nr:hypothetical protein BN6_54670 [Saccharothrix espanaensis DSM 44229]
MHIAVLADAAIKIVEIHHGVHESTATPNGSSAPSGTKPPTTRSSSTNTT